MGEVIRSVNLDAGESIFFARELEFIKSKSYDIKYGELKARMILPVSYEAGPGAESITYRQYDQLGVAKFIANYANDLPRADIKGREYTSPVRSEATSYGYTLQEVRAAKLTGKPLEQRRANSAKRAILQLENTTAFFGNAEVGLSGFINASNTNVVSVPADGTGNTTQWVNKTADQILRDMNLIANSIFSATKGVEQPSTMLLPLDQYTLVTSTPRSAISDVTIAEFFLKNNPFVEELDWLNELKGAGASSTDRCMAYDRDQDKLSLEIPQDFEQLPVQEEGLEFIIPCHARLGGVIIYYPLSIAVADGI